VFWRWDAEVNEVGSAGRAVRRRRSRFDRPADGTPHSSADHNFYA
jgi:hypothetical protein